MAAPREYRLTDIPQNFRDLRTQSLYVSPWPAGWWRFADAVAYDEIASLSVLEYAARYKDSLLYNRYQAGRDQIAAGKKTAPSIGRALAVDPAQNNAYRAINTAWRMGAEVQFKAAAADGGARYLIRGLTEAAQADLVRTLALTAARTDAAGKPVKKPRLGLFQPWSGSMDEGWTRWILEQYGFEYALLHPEDFHKALRDQADVIILADDARVPLENVSAAALCGSFARSTPTR